MVLHRLFPNSVRDERMVDLLQTFFVAAVATVLIIRTQLWLTHYPQLGGAGLHIAHLLYGGVFMAFAIGVLLVHVNRAAKIPAAILGGIGFGFFIDELGKFITEDNDYFFTPAAALIYLVFVAFFFIIKSVARRQGLSPQERLANAIVILGGEPTGDFDEPDRKRALQLLSGADQADPLTVRVKQLLDAAAARPPKPPGRVKRFGDAVWGAYDRLVSRPWFPRAFCWAIGVVGLLTVVGIAVHIISAATGHEGESLSDIGFISWASLATSAVSGLLITIGILALLAGERRRAYRRFEQAVLVAIFLTTVFSFIETQFGAVIGLGVYLLALVTIRRLSAAESGKEVTP